MIIVSLIMFIVSLSLLILLGDIISQTSLPFAIIRLLINAIIAIIYFILIRNSDIPKAKLSILSIIFTSLLILFELFIIYASGLTDIVNQVLKSHTFLIVLFTALSAGLAEEAIFRGLLQGAFSKLFQKSSHTFLIASIFSSILFGMVHLTNIFSVHQSVAVSLQQVITAFAIGISFAAIRTFTGGITTTVIIHTLFDFQSDIATGVETASPWSQVVGLYGSVIVVSIIIIMIMDHNTNKVRDK